MKAALTTILLTLLVSMNCFAYPDIPEPLHDEIGWKAGTKIGDMWVLESRGYQSWGNKIQVVLDSDCSPTHEVLHLVSHKLTEMEKIPDIFEMTTLMEVETDDWGGQEINPFMYRPRNYKEITGVRSPFEVVMISGKFMDYREDRNPMHGNILRVSFKKESIHYNLFDVNNELFSMDGLMAAYLETIDRCNKDKLLLQQ
jgi:hypothetical protein